MGSFDKPIIGGKQYYRVTANALPATDSKWAGLYAPTITNMNDGDWFLFPSGGENNYDGFYTHFDTFTIDLLSIPTTISTFVPNVHNPAGYVVTVGPATFSIAIDATGFNLPLLGLLYFKYGGILYRAYVQFYKFFFGRGVDFHFVVLSGSAMDRRITIDFVTDPDSVHQATTVDWQLIGTDGSVTHLGNNKLLDVNLTPSQSGVYNHYTISSGFGFPVAPYIQAVCNNALNEGPGQLLPPTFGLNYFVPVAKLKVDNGTNLGSGNWSVPDTLAILDASDSFDPDGTIVNYHWMIGSPVQKTYDTTNPVLPLDFDEGFKSLIQVQVTDNEGFQATSPFISLQVGIRARLLYNKHLRALHYFYADASMNVLCASSLNLTSFDIASAVKTYFLGHGVSSLAAFMIGSMPVVAYSTSDYGIRLCYSKDHGASFTNVALFPSAILRGGLYNEHTRSLFMLGVSVTGGPIRRFCARYNGMNWTTDDITDIPSLPSTGVANWHLFWRGSTLTVVVEHDAVVEMYASTDDGYTFTLQHSIEGGYSPMSARWDQHTLSAFILSRKTGAEVYRIVARTNGAGIWDHDDIATVDGLVADSTGLAHELGQGSVYAISRAGAVLNAVISTDEAYSYSGI